MVGGIGAGTASMNAGIARRGGIERRGEEGRCRNAVVRVRIVGGEVNLSVTVEVVSNSACVA